MVKRGVLKEHSKALDLSKKLLDILIVICSAYLAFLYKFGVEQDIYWRYWTFIAFGSFLALIVFNLFPLYHSWRGITLFTEYRIVFLVWTVTCLFLMVFSFILKVSIAYSREWLFIWYLIALCFFLFYRLCLRITLRHFRRLGYNQKWICLIAYGKNGERVFNNIINNPWLGYNFSSLFANTTNNELYKNYLTGQIKDSYKWLQKNEVDQVWIAVPLEKIAFVKKLVYVMRHKTTDIRFIPDMESYNLINHSISEIAGIPIVNLSSSPMQDNINRLLKRCEDAIIASLILLLISPLLLIISIIIKFTSPGPVLYKQTRVGFNNKPFTIYKFRSMPVDIEKNTGAAWAKSGEQRATKFGSFLRKTSLDELPQFINVIKGNMSIVGPRPERPEFVDQFKEEIPSYMKKHMVKAGITGWAQVNGWRGNTDLKKRIEYDIYYIENWSVLFDLKIILMTVIKGFINKNAY